MNTGSHGLGYSISSYNVQPESLLFNSIQNHLYSSFKVAKSSLYIEYLNSGYTFKIESMYLSLMNKPDVIVERKKNSLRQYEEEILRETRSQKRTDIVIVILALS